VSAVVRDSDLPLPHSCDVFTLLFSKIPQPEGADRPCGHPRGTADACLHHARIVIQCSQVFIDTSNRCPPGSDAV
jgi:hypothetical protein